MDYLGIYIKLLGCDYTYDEQDIRRNFNHRGKCVDCYVHRIRCDHFLIEGKGTNIGEAIDQFRETVKALKHSNAPLKGCILLLKEITRFYRNIYKIIGGKLYRQDGRKIMVEEYPVDVVYYRNIDREMRRRR